MDCLYGFWNSGIQWYRFTVYGKCETMCGFPLVHRCHFIVEALDMMILSFKTFASEKNLTHAVRLCPAYVWTLCVVLKPASLLLALIAFWEFCLVDSFQLSFSVPQQSLVISPLLITYPRKRRAAWRKKHWTICVNCLVEVQEVNTKYSKVKH